MSLDVLKTAARRGPVISEYQRISASNAADIAVPSRKKSRIAAARARFRLLFLRCI
jgi:hypothetical protein